MTDRPETRQNFPHADGCPSTKSTLAARPQDIPADDIEAMPATKTLAGASPGTTSENPASQRLPTQFGRYRLIRELGRGGMGAVVLAEDTQLGRQVALKIPFLKKASEARSVKRFQREAKAAAALSHPNLCAVYDFGTFNNQHFLSMAYIEGKPLQAFLDSGTLIPQRTAAGIVRKIAQALQHAHERGVIHRDLKPSNIMIEPKLGPVVTDFGLARCLDDEGEVQLTQDGVAIGTPSYMSPEQLEGDSSQIGPQSDVFSLGLILFEMLTGQRRFQGKVTRIIGQILTKDPGSLRDIREDVDPHLDRICQKMMARGLPERYASMAEVANVMRAYLKGELSPLGPSSAGEEFPSDPEAFFLGLSTEEAAGRSALSTQSGAGWMRTQEELMPRIVISDEDSQSSRVLQRWAKSKRSKKPLLTIGVCLVAGVFGFALHHATSRDSGPNLGTPDLSAGTNVAAHQPELAASETDSRPQPPARPLPADPAPSTNDGNASGEVIWKVEEIPPNPSEIPQPDPPPADPMPVSKPPVLDSPEPKPAEEEPVKLRPAAGKLEFQATVKKTINGSSTEKKYNTVRSALPELAQLERRQKDNDKALEELRVRIGLNENRFEFQEAKTARELATALEEAIPQNILAEEIFAKLEYLNPKLATHPPVALGSEDAERIRAEVQKLHNLKSQQLQTQLMFGRVSQPQEEVDKAQAHFEQECQMIQGIPKNYSLPKLRIRILPLGTTNPVNSRLYVGDAERHKEQNPRGQLIKRIAAALNAGTLINLPTD